MSPKAHNISLCLSMPKFSTCDSFMLLMTFGKKSMMHLENSIWVQNVTFTFLASASIFPCLNSFYPSSLCLSRIFDGLGGLRLSPKGHLYISRIPFSLFMLEFSTFEDFMPINVFLPKVLDGLGGLRLSLKGLSWQLYRSFMTIILLTKRTIFLCQVQVGSVSLLPLSYSVKLDHNLLSSWLN